MVVLLGAAGPTPAAVVTGVLFLVAAAVGFARSRAPLPALGRA
jgi:hypothetical protein